MPTLRVSAARQKSSLARVLPAKLMLPDFNGTNPAIALSKVDLPQPLGPSKQPISPTATAKLTSCTML